jgi:hypothetical protein
VAKNLRLTLEVGPKGKKVVAVATDWPGLERSAKSAEDAIQKLQSYIPRYVQVATLAGMQAQFAAGRGVEVLEQYPGVGSTDFWGISFAFSSFDIQTMSDKELDRELALMRACWTFFDVVRARVSADMRKGPRGGGRDRDRIVGHVLGVEQDWAKKLGLNASEEIVTDAKGLLRFRDDYCAAIQTYHSEGRMARTWPLRFLIRHTAFHMLDHSWEMEDKDLSIDGADR